MPPATPQSRRRTNLTADNELNKSRASNLKRKDPASATTPNNEPRAAKRVKVEPKPTTEHEIPNPDKIVPEPLYDSIITVKVDGDNGPTYPIHRGLLRSASRVFRDILPAESPTVEGEENTFSASATEVLLPDETHHCIRRFGNWLYAGYILSPAHETPKSIPWSSIITMYAFGNRIKAPQLQNHCIDTIIRKRQEGGLFPSKADVNSIWNATPPSQFIGLQRLLLEMFAAECNLKHAMIAGNGDYHARFLQGLVETLFEMKEKKGTLNKRIEFWKKRKVYYVEDDENPIAVD